MSKLTIESKDKKIREIAGCILGKKPSVIYQVCEKYGSDDEDIRYYDVYEIHTESGDYVLKKAGKYELFNYENYLKYMNFSVPTFFGGTKLGASRLLRTYLQSGIDAINKATLVEIGK